MIDLHVHTWRCRHADGTAEDFVRAAADKGVRLLAFTEHLPLAPALMEQIPGAETYAMPADEWPAYLAEVERAAVLGAELGVEVLGGAEIDAVPVALGHAASFLEQYPVDLVLGSVHFIDDWAFDDPQRIERYDQWTVEDLWERYFDDLVAAARTGQFDVLAHADLIKKFCHRPEGSLDRLYGEVAAAVASAGVAVEVNSAGLRKPCRELYPAQPLLAAFFRAGVPTTIGSDAHAPAEVGSGMTEAVAALRDAGYRSVLVYRQRQPEEVGIDDL